MDPATRLALNRINRRFYAERAQAFSDTRPTPWPGWEPLVPLVEARAGRDAPVPVLDVGCGNGRFARFAAERWPGRVRYTGVDASGALLAVARARDPGAGRYLCRDFVEADPDAALPRGPFALSALFGVLHHVPGADARGALLRALVARLAPGGLLVFNVWRFGDHERMRRRSLDWDAFGGPDPAGLEPGDVLLRWGHDPEALRYVHFLGADEVARLVASLPAAVAATWESDDGRGGNRYLALEPAGDRAGA